MNTKDTKNTPDTQLTDKEVEQKVEEAVKAVAQKFGEHHCKDNCKQKGSVSKNASCGSAGFVWFAGFVGAAIYFIQAAPTFWAGFLGVLKALVWPAYLIYHLFTSLHIQ